MLTRLNTYLRLHYPLLWNTRVFTVIAVALLLHLLFFIAGYASITPKEMAEHYSLAGVGGGTMYTFSVLCSMGVLIGWLVFYLRNNAYKQFYIIPKFHLAAEFVIITVVSFVSINFFDSFSAGAGLKVTRITNEAELAEEVNIINIAAAFLPTSRTHYFKYNDCDTANRDTIVISYNENIDYFDTLNSSYNSPAFVRMRQTVREPDAFSYRHYCRRMEQSSSTGVLTRAEVTQKIRHIISTRNRDSINRVLQSFLAISKKYGETQSFNVATKADWVFEDTLNSVRHIINANYWNESDPSQQGELVNYHGISRAVALAEDAHEGFYVNDLPERFLFEGYFALSMAILIFAYRLFSRRIFLISIIGSIVIALLMLLFGVSSGGDGVAHLFIALTLIFLVAALILFQQRAGKTVPGTLLSWHIYMIPYLVPLIVALIDDRYSRLYSSTQVNGVYIGNEAEIRTSHPFTWWVHHHDEFVIGLNLLFVILYTAFVFTRFAKKQHMLANE